MEWNEKKEQVLRHDGRTYRVSPELLLWDNEYYYLVAYDEDAQAIRHYRVDKIANAQEISQGRGGQEVRAGLHKADYTKKRFGMFAGQPTTVSLRAPKQMAGILCTERKWSPHLFLIRKRLMKERMFNRRYLRVLKPEGLESRKFKIK